VRTGEISGNLNPQEMADVFFSLMESNSFRMLLATETTPEAAKARYKCLIGTVLHG
jgi:hypothetical protein